MLDLFTSDMITLTRDRHSSLQQKNANSEMMKMISMKELDVSTAIAKTENQPAEVNTKLEELHLAIQDEGEGEMADQASATSQVEIERFALGKSLELLNELLRRIQSAASDAQKSQDRVINTYSFGDHNQGVQTGVSCAPIHFTVGRGRDNN